MVPPIQMGKINLDSDEKAKSFRRHTYRSLNNAGLNAGTSRSTNSDSKVASVTKAMVNSKFQQRAVKNTHRLSVKSNQNSTSSLNSDGFKQINIIKSTGNNLRKMNTQTDGLTHAKIVKHIKKNTMHLKQSREEQKVKQLKLM